MGVGHSVTKGGGSVLGYLPEFHAAVHASNVRGRKRFRMVKKIFGEVRRKVRYADEVLAKSLIRLLFLPQKV